MYKILYLSFSELWQSEGNQDIIGLDLYRYKVPNIYALTNLPADMLPWGFSKIGRVDEKGVICLMNQSERKEAKT